MIKCAIIDWETLSLEKNAKVLAVAMTVFDLQVESTIDELRANTFSLNITNEGQEDRDVNQETVDWWANQCDEAKADLEKPPKVSLEAAIHTVTAFIEKHDVKFLIGNGENFDNAILYNICKQLDMEYPVPFWADADLRTMKLMAGLQNSREQFPKGLTKHIASDDAIFEAMVAQTCYRKCRNGWSN